jgi:hypothetical protein
MFHVAREFIPVFPSFAGFFHKVAWNMPPNAWNIHSIDLTVTMPKRAAGQG